MTLLVELPAADLAVLNEITIPQPDAAVTITRAQRFDGRPDLVQAAIIAAPIVMTRLISAITTVICKQLEAQRYIEIEYNGFRLKGLNVKNAEKLLLQVIKNQQSQISRDQAATKE